MIRAIAALGVVWAAAGGNVPAEPTEAPAVATGPSYEPPTESTAGAFVRHEADRQFSVDGPDFELSYGMGSVEGNPAVLFKAVFYTESAESVSWAAVGFRALPNGSGGAPPATGLKGFDFYSFDNSTTTRFVDCWVPTEDREELGLVEDTVQNGVLVSHARKPLAFEVSFYRLLDTNDPDDYALVPGAEFELAWASGEGSAFRELDAADGTARGTLEAPAVPEAPGAEGAVVPAPEERPPFAPCAAPVVVADGAVRVVYERGSVAAAAAIRFTLSFPRAPDGSTWAAVGVRGARGDAMLGLDTCACDSGGSVADSTAEQRSGAPQPDAVRDCYLESATARDGTVEVAFTRNLQPSDPGGHLIGTGAPTYLSWAYGPGTVQAWTKHSVAVTLEDPIQSGCADETAVAEDSSGGGSAAERRRLPYGAVALIVVAVFVALGAAGWVLARAKAASKPSYRQFMGGMSFDQHDEPALICLSETAPVVDTLRSFCESPTIGTV
ncbi:hypothetical protein DIPPA_23780 [Diplonema papillatum]|nr:hypothetical protein DIPPA_23780 [Diplonema papillatum]|eukprot:gene13663-21021_t